MTLVESISEYEYQEVKAPPLCYALTEGGRALTELASLPLMSPLLLSAPMGDGHPVMVLPGFVAGDRSTIALRRFLQNRGYRPYAWELGQNFGPLTIGPEGELLSVRLMSIFRKTRRKVTLIGWSLGGIMARELAKALPNQVRQVITLGSPFNGNPRASNVARFYEMISGQPLESDDAQDLIQSMRTPPPGIPCTSIYTKTDGVVAWQNCVENPSPLTDNIEVYASHCGLGVNASVLYAVADRLALPETDWQPFDRSATWRRLVYPHSGH